MNQILKRLRSPRIDAKSAADFLQKNIGDGANAMHCKDALIAVENMRVAGLVKIAKTALLLSSSESDCADIEAIILTFEGQASNLNKLTKTAGCSENEK